MHTPLYRPPAEADSLIIQVDRGCPHNRCTFCGMYRGQPYHARPLSDALALIQRETGAAPTTSRVFLADGNVMQRPFEELSAMLQALADALPRLARVSVYANGRAIHTKSDDELAQLRALKLHTLYMGLESGDERVLRHCRKGDTAEQMVDAAIRAQAAGLRLSVMVLLGLGGRDGSHDHASFTAAALNRMQPRLLSALRVVPVPGTELYDEVAAGHFHQLSEQGVILELRDLVSHLDLTGTVFRANHSSNVVPIEARLSRDKARLLDQLDRLLASDALDAQSPGALPLWL